MGILCMALGALSLVFSPSILSIPLGVVSLILFFVLKKKNPGSKDYRWARVGMVGSIFGLTSVLLNVLMNVAGAQYMG